jgi:tRNA-Thr(GGU) m(6)t(6)A37 methyltransferase TsaA
MTIELEAIGTIRTPFATPSGMPKNPRDAEGVAGRIVLRPEYAPGLKDLDGFSHVVVLFHFHRSDGWTLEVVPPGQDRPRGVFATRAPRRPNPIGVSVVRLDAIEGATLHIRDVDMVDGTPLLDLKPYLPTVDAATEVRTGWLHSGVDDTDEE